MPEPWGIEFPSKVEVAPDERKELALRLTGVSTNALEGAVVRITGEFGDAGQAVLSVRLMPAAH